MPPQISIDHNLCTRCIKCVRSCPAEILIHEKKENQTPRSIIEVTDPNLCYECRACEVVCPVFAVNVMCTAEEELVAP
ncbi:MAG: 4Fe-4S dicluster domain-containing protein [Candidatus Hodarchaeota archaeon]